MLTPRKASRASRSLQTWASGYGVIKHRVQTQKRIHELARRWHQTRDGVPFWDLLVAADRLSSAAMWLTVHDTYAKNVFLDGRPLQLTDFKDAPEGHTGSSLNIIPAYVGYLVANVITGDTRGWLAEQGHAVSGIDCVNVLVRNVTPAHERYTFDDAGLSHFVRDFYNYDLQAGGARESARGSHVGPHTAGGIAEGGYLGFGGLQYVHIPLPGEKLVAFLSDGAFEEQRGPDWAPRWWRHEDCGLVTPVMINNGRRIDQRTTMAQLGGTRWFLNHLRLNHFDPIVIDGRDPAAFVWLILEAERRLTQAPRKYPVRLPYGIAVTVKGYGFYAAGTNAAHNLPLGSDIDALALETFNKHAKRLWVPESELRAAAALFQHHRGRPRERDNPMATRQVDLEQRVEPRFARPADTLSAMSAVDDQFVETCLANPHLRPRVGNPDEMRSNRLNLTLDNLKHRVTTPEAGIAEAVLGRVITALNEEAVASAALANKGGINLIHSYEAFGAKMLGAIRQEIIFAHHCMQAGRPAGWLSVPVVLTSHTYENGKNEQSHQDPVTCEALLGEPAHLSRVLFPADYNSAAAVMEAVYQSHGQIWTVVVPKRPTPVVFDGDNARHLLREGALRLVWDAQPAILMTAIGAYQLQQAMRASVRLHERGVAHCLTYMIEPRRFAEPKDAEEARIYVAEDVRASFFPDSVAPRLFVTHTRAGRIQGLLQVVDTGPKTLALGYRNAGGTYDVGGMLFINHQSWGHILAACAHLIDMPLADILDEHEIDIVAGRIAPPPAYLEPFATLPEPAWQRLVGEQTQPGATL